MTRIAYYKDGKEVAKPKAVFVDGINYVMPTDEQILAAGYEIKEVDVPQYEPTYDERVSALIRERYTQDAVEALFANYLADAEKYAEEMAAFQAYRAECKQKAKED